MSAADCPENPLPDPACLHLSINVAALAELRTAKQKQLQEGGSQAAIGDAAAAATPAAAAVGAASAAATGGLWGCAGEWAGLSCRHRGSWQLSLLYNPEELARFSTVSHCSRSNARGQALPTNSRAAAPAQQASRHWLLWHYALRMWPRLWRQVLCPTSWHVNPGRCKPLHTKMLLARTWYRTAGSSASLLLPA